MAELTILSWLSRLGLRCASTRATENVEVRCRTYVEPLSDLPAWAFCDESLEAMARKYEFFPPYARLRKDLEEWIGRNRPAVQMLPAGHENVPPDPERWYIGWFRPGATPDVPNGRTLQLACIRDRAPAVYQYLLKTDNEAYRIARDRQWLDR